MLCREGSGVLAILSAVFTTLCRCFQSIAIAPIPDSDAAGQDALITGFSLKACRMTSNTVICVKSHLGAVPRDIPSTVKVADLSENKISRIQVADFKNLPLLTQLELNRNHISQIDNGAFANLICLEKLNLNNNKLVELGEDVFHGLSNLTELRLSSNRIQTVASSSFRSMTSLKFLDISHNKLYEIAKVHSILQHLPHLRELYIKNNNINTFHSWELTNSSLELGYLDLSQNPIAVFQITGLHSLQNLAVGSWRSSPQSLPLSAGASSP
uniref:Uncharacterized protein n=1 Tax=Monopterus albus TaxID=43700 RepID=A0A3Q3JBP9_MONAL